MGFSQVLLNLGKFAKRLKGCMEDIDSFHPDVVILIDYPGFNFRVAQAAHEKGYKVFYYIAPKVWASRESRVKKIKKYVDRLFIVFPFEKEYFKKKGIDYIYKGNPLVDAIDSSPLVNMSREEFFKANSLPECKYIAILAGSRKGEVGTMMPVCAEFIKKMSSTPGYEDYRFLIAGAPSRTMDDYAPYLEGISDRAKVIFSQTYAILKNAEAAVINSGTASLEACLIGTPQVVGFVLSPFNFTLGRQIIKVDMISLGNLILGRKAFKELLQHYFSAENLLSEVRRLVEDSAYRETMKEDYATIRKELGGSGASAAVAEAMVGELRKG